MIRARLLLPPRGVSGDAAGPGDEQALERSGWGGNASNRLGMRRDSWAT